MLRLEQLKIKGCIEGGGTRNHLLGQGRKDQLGSLSLEASLSLPFILLLILTFILSLRAISAEQALRRAGEQVAAESELWQVFADLGEGQDLAQLLRISKGDGQAIKQLWDMLDQPYQKDFVEKGMHFFATKSLLKRTRAFLEASVPKIETSLLEDLQLELNWQPEAKELILVYHYRLNCLGFSTKRQLSVPMTWWLDPHMWKFEGRSSDKKEAQSIWSADNFTRGRYFRERYKANLPIHYAGIAQVQGQTLTAIHSLDLTAPNYANQRMLEKQVNSYVKRLQDFDTQVLIKDGYWSKSMQAAYKLKIIVPSNSLPERLTWLEGIQSQLGARGVDFEWIQDEASYAYTKEGLEDGEAKP